MTSLNASIPVLHRMHVSQN